MLKEDLLGGEAYGAVHSTQFSGKPKIVLNSSILILKTMLIICIINSWHNTHSLEIIIFHQVNFAVVSF